MATLRLQKIISNAGVLSRRAAEQAITEGRVKLNGATVTELGTKGDPDQDLIEVDGKPLPKTPKTRPIIAFYKPKRTMTTRSDPEGRRTVMDLIPAPFREAGMYPVGRLDYDTEGLLLLTNDGDFAHQILHPRFEIGKTYRAQISRPPLPETLEKLCAGVLLDDGMGRFKKIRLIQKSPQVWLELEVGEGRNRFVRRMLSAVGHPVLELCRIRIGGLTLERLGLKPQQWKLLSEKERELLLHPTS